ncbi:MAG: hypothetical protein HY843_00985 [Bdellovibrio sp.]|nr:hypothetical protein [Bdellovibrio sp.]
MSCEGQVWFPLLLQYEKVWSGRTKIYGQDLVLDGDGEIQKKLQDYVVKIVKALKIQFGPCHAKVMIDEKGPVLIEIAARVDGISSVSLEEQVCGRSQVQLTIDAYLCQNKLKELPFTYKRKLFAKVVNFISHHCGVIVSENKLQEIKALQSFAGMRTRVHTGKKLEKTIDLATSPGFAFLAHSDSVQLENDYAQIRSWEKEGLLFSLK